MKFTDRLQHAWNAFMNKDPTSWKRTGSTLSSYRTDRHLLSTCNERSIVNSIYNRISVDAAAIKINHVRLDENDRYKETINSGLNNIFNLEANIDQTGRAFIQDAVMSMLDEGCIALVPIDTSLNPNNTDGYDIETMRVGKILEWYPRYVKVRVYNDRTGQKEDLVLSKSFVGIVENPFYSVMNEPNSTLQRLIRKLNILDAIDEQSGSGKLDLIIQLPYVIKTPARKEQAEQRRKDIENQLSGSKYGIAYTDGTEHITQLNRPVENNLLSQIQYLTSMLFSQLNLTENIFNGTASQEEQLNYMNRTIEPIISAIVDECRRKFLSKTARTRKQDIRFFNDPFKIVPVEKMADIADKFTRNEILSSNEVREIVGRKPVDTPEADELRNKNLNQSTEQIQKQNYEETTGNEYEIH